jgi:carboxypeptidase C (cathepsin A)
LLFIDSPLNAGFSKRGDRIGKDQVSSTDQTTNHLCNFLFNFYNEFPNLKKAPIYLAGESFAGHYIPSLAVKIINNRTKLNQTGIEVKGVLIGGGWVDPIHQLNHYDSYLWSVGIAEGGFREQLTWHQTHATINLFGFHYENATEFINFIIYNRTTHEKYMGNISEYNFRNYEGVDLSFVPFLNNHKEQFGVSVDYINFNDAIYHAFKRELCATYAGAFIDMLGKTRVLVYNGQYDVVVNNGGVLTYLNSLHWDGIESWKRTRKTRWTIGGHMQGWAKNSGNLWFVHVNGAGHMVPYDRPEAALVLFGHFLRNDHDGHQ